MMMNCLLCWTLRFECCARFFFSFVRWDCFRRHLFCSSVINLVECRAESKVLCHCVHHTFVVAFSQSVIKFIERWILFCHKKVFVTKWQTSKAMKITKFYFLSLKILRTSQPFPINEFVKTFGFSFLSVLRIARCLQFADVRLGWVCCEWSFFK